MSGRLPLLLLFLTALSLCCPRATCQTRSQEPLSGSNRLDLEPQNKAISSVIGAANVLVWKSAE
jgi:hypothetical protein